MTSRTSFVLVLALAATPLASQEAAPAAGSPAPSHSEMDARVQDVRAVFDGLNLGPIIEVMAEESRAQSEALEPELFAPGVAPPDWDEVLDGIYNADRLKAEVLASLEESLADADVGAILAFLESEPGARLMDLELAARRAMADDEVEQAAREAAAVAMVEPSPRLDLLRQYAEVNDIVELNVAGMLNSNYAYVAALMNGGALGRDVTESDLLADVWSQEDQVRATTLEWVYSFLLKAYEPASDADLQALIDFSRSGAGQAMNHAVFAAFDEEFRAMSQALGHAVARYLTTEEI